jgi:NAD(P)-dependent dehydrogenase (short-subunit alcohol dehydrogenase family)
MDRTSLAGRPAIITGGARGIGYAVASRLQQAGAKLALFDSDADGVAKAASALDALAFEVDVRDAGAVNRAVAEAHERMGGLAILVNNAGIGALQPFHEYSDESFADLIAVNLTGTFHCMRAAIPLMLTGGGGAIVNNASGSGVRPTRGEMPYSAAKAGVIAMTSSAAQEYGPTVRVNAVSPGVIRTPLTELLFKIPGALDPVERSTPLGRTGDADEVADVIYFLCSDLSSYVTGQNLVIDGGMGLAQAGADETLRSSLEMMAKFKKD